MSEWISVEERLPPASHDEIVVWNGKWSRVGKYLAASMCGDCFFYTHYDDVLHGITHWMPLPEPPK